MLGWGLGRDGMSVGVVVVMGMCGGCRCRMGCRLGRWIEGWVEMAVGERGVGVV